MQHETLIQFERLVSRYGDPSKRDLGALILKLVNRVNDLEGQIESLESALKLDRTANTQAAFGIPETLAQILIILSDGLPHSREAIHGVLFFRRPEIDVPELKNIDSLVYQLRKATKAHGIVIDTIWGTSVQITSGLDIVLAAMETAVPKIPGTDSQQLPA